jgi:hypothetical protein
MNKSITKVSQLLDPHDHAPQFSQLSTGQWIVGSRVVRAADLLRSLISVF